MILAVALSTSKAGFVAFIAEYGHFYARNGEGVCVAFLGEL